MCKSLKFYLILLGTVILLAGCTRTDVTVSADITTTPQETETVETTQTPEITETPEVTEEPVPEESAHPVLAEGIDYLSVEGVALEPGMEIAMIATDSGNSFYDMVKKGAVQAVSDLNEALGYSGKQKLTLSFDSPKKENAIDQINIVDQFLDKAPDALCIAFTDATACKTQMEMAKNNGIRLIAFDTPDESKITETLVSTDNMAAATVAAGKMFESLEQGAKIAIIAHNATKQTGLERYRAITNEYTGQYKEKEFRFVDVVYVAQDDRSDKEIFEELLTDHPDLDGIICTDLVTTEMTIDYAKSMGEKTFQIVGFDVSEKIASAIGDGTIVGSVAQDPYGMGYATVVAAVRSIAGLDNAENVYSAHLWIDGSNLESDEAQSLFTWR